MIIDDPMTALRYAIEGFLWRIEFDEIFMFTLSCVVAVAGIAFLAALVQSIAERYKWWKWGKK